MSEGSEGIEHDSANLLCLKEYLNYHKKDFLEVRTQKEMRKTLLQTGGKEILVIK